METTKNLSKRNVGGNRVICRCVFLFPKSDPFSPSQVTKSGVLVFNVRGASFYCRSQYDEKTILTVFDPSRPTVLPLIRCKPVDTPEFHLEKYQARFLKFNHLNEHSGMTFRFVHQTDQQLETLNLLTENLPKLEQSEEHHVNELMKG